MQRRTDRSRQHGPRARARLGRSGARAPTRCRAGARRSPRSSAARRSPPTRELAERADVAVPLPQAGAARGRRGADGRQRGQGRRRLDPRRRHRSTPCAPRTRARAVVRVHAEHRRRGRQRRALPARPRATTRRARSRSCSARVGDGRRGPRETDRGRRRRSRASAPRTWALFVEAQVDAAVRRGMPPALAVELATATTEGRRRCSPHATTTRSRCGARSPRRAASTARGLAALEHGGVRAAFQAAAEAAVHGGRR